MAPTRLLLVLLLALWGGCAWATDDLLSIYRDASLADPVFQQARARLRAARELVPQARAELLPEITASVEVDRVFQDQVTSFESSDTAFWSEFYSLNLTQPVFRWSLFRRLDQADEEEARAVAEFAAAEQELIFRVAERYFGVLDARAALAAAEADLQAIGRQLEQARQRFEVGLIARTDVEEAKARFDLAQADAIQARNLLSSARERLREVIGREPGQLQTVREGVELAVPEPRDEAAWRARAREQNWSLAAARKASQAAMTGIGVARGGHYPTVDAQASFSTTESGGTFGSETDRKSIGLRVNVPLFAGGGTSSRVREAQALYTEARERLEEVLRSVTRQAADAYRTVESNLLRVQALDQARISTKAALEATEAGFEVGTRTIVEVLNAVQNMTQAQRDYRQARHAYLLETLRLKQAAGTLSDADVHAVNALLQRQP